MSDYVNSVETIVVDQVTKYGVKVNGKSYNSGKKYTGPVMELGKTYEVQISTSPNGAKYVNNAKEIATSTMATKTIAIGNTHIITNGNQTTTNVPFKARDFDAEARGKTRCALYEAALQSAYLTSSQDDEEFKRRADDLVSYFFNKVFEK